MKRTKRYVWAVSVFTLVFLFLWLHDLSWRFLGTGLSADPSAAVFDQTLTVSAEEAVQLGYGPAAFLNILISLMRGPLVAAAAGCGILAAIALVTIRRLHQKTDHQQKLIHELQADNRILSHRLQSHLRDVEAQTEGYENLAHQLKSSLNSLTLRLELQGFERDAEDSLAHMNAQIDAFLRQSTVHSNEPDLQLSLISMRTVVKSVLEQTAGYRQEVQTILQPGWLYGDAQVLGNACEALIVNALRHGQGYPVQIRLEDDNDQIMLSVMNHTELQELPDTRRYKTEEPGHYGIGRDLARTAARQHGGTVSWSLKESCFHAVMILPVLPWETDTAKFLKSSDGEI